MAREGSAEYIFPLKPPFPLFFSATGLIVRDCHNKRLRFFVFTYDRFSLYLPLFCFSQLFSVKMAVFGISEKNLLVNQNFEKSKLPEHFDPPFKHFFVVKPFSL